MKQPLFFMLTAVVFKVVNRIFWDAEVTGDPAPPVESPIIYVANHANYFDPFIINAYLREYVRIAATERPYRNPLSRWYMLAVGTYPLPRYKSAAIDSVRRSLRILREGTCLALSPEGERSWDAEPMEISDAVVRFLQKAGAPIVVVNLSGTYNVFPRWASRPRRGKIRLHFHPPFLLSQDKSVEENKRMLHERLHSPGGSYDESVWVKGRNPAKGLPLLLWRCPLCTTNDSLHVEDGAYLRCEACDSRWELTRNYHLKLLRNSSDREAPAAKTLGDWYSLIKEVQDISPANINCEAVEEGETAYLESDRVRYSSYDNLKKCFCYKGRLILTDRRLIFVGGQKVLSDALSDIGKVVIEGNDCVELGFSDRMISIKFNHESPLKWQAYINRVKAVACLPD